jgi:hypothetical protein
VQPAVITPTARPQLANSLVRQAPIAAPNLANAWPANITLFALADGTVFPVTQYWLNHDQIMYVSDGDKGTVPLGSIDWTATTKLNTARSVRVILRNAPPPPDAGAN